MTPAPPAPLKMPVHAIPGNHDDGSLSADRLAWLRDQLAVEPATPTVVAMHLEIGGTILDLAEAAPGFALHVALGDECATHVQVVTTAA